MVMFGRIINTRIENIFFFVLKGMMIQSYVNQFVKRYHKRCELCTEGGC
jgi:hypothetical protein